uniref:Small EDRK-rich factor-like N-terminal domain-containing protein n=1 Tax=Amphilophus citrinellus TaxID=61819 RepID=A0A3Q0SEK6_AMPCI
MARGHQKIQSQQKNAKKQAEMKKAKGHDQKTAAKAALVFTCSVCKNGSILPCINGSGCCWWCNGVGEVFFSHFQYQPSII